MTSTAGTGTETEDMVDAPTGDATCGHRWHLVLSRGVSKRYGPVQANDDITIDFRAGEIHALLGENGSGKSTVLGIASGAVEPDAGEVVIAGEPLTTASPKEAMRLGLGMAYQTMTEVAGLTVAENLFLAAPELVRRYGRMEDWATQKLSDYQLDIRAAADRDPVARAATDARSRPALLSHPKVLLLDEPTTALGRAEVDRLHELIRAWPPTEWESSTSATGCRRCSRWRPCHGAARRRHSGHVRRKCTLRGRRRHTDGGPADGHVVPRVEGRPAGDDGCS